MSDFLEKMKRAKIEFRYCLLIFMCLKTNILFYISYFHFLSFPLFCISVLISVVSNNNTKRENDRIKFRILSNWDF